MTSKLLTPEEYQILKNVADDFEHNFESWKVGYDHGFHYHKKGFIIKVDENYSYKGAPHEYSVIGVTKDSNFSIRIAAVVNKYLDDQRNKKTMKMLEESRNLGC